jgi:hypothetical protein
VGDITKGFSGHFTATNHGGEPAIHERGSFMGVPMILVPLLFLPKGVTARFFLAVREGEREKNWEIIGVQPYPIEEITDPRILKEGLLVNNYGHRALLLFIQGPRKFHQRLAILANDGHWRIYAPNDYDQFVLKKPILQKLGVNSDEPVTIKWTSRGWNLSGDGVDAFEEFLGEEFQCSDEIPKGDQGGLSWSVFYKSGEYVSSLYKNGKEAEDNDKEEGEDEDTEEAPARAPRGSNPTIPFIVVLLAVVLAVFWYNYDRNKTFDEAAFRAVFQSWKQDSSPYQRIKTITTVRLGADKLMAYERSCAEGSFEVNLDRIHNEADARQALEKILHDAETNNCGRGE